MDVLGKKLRDCMAMLESIRSFLAPPGATPDDDIIRDSVMDATVLVSTAFDAWMRLNGGEPTEASDDVMSALGRVKEKIAALDKLEIPFGLHDGDNPEKIREFLRVLFFHFEIPGDPFVQLGEGSQFGKPGVFGVNGHTISSFSLPKTRGYIPARAVADCVLEFIGTLYSNHFVGFESMFSDAFSSWNTDVKWKFKTA